MRVDNIKFQNGWLGLKTSDPAAMRWALSAEPGEYDITPHIEKRSLSANAYMWMLCDKLAAVLRVTKENIYRDAIRNVGLFCDMHIMQDEADTFQTAWGMLGTGWFSEILDYQRDGVNFVIRAYYGSSKYDSKQMARLIDYIVQGCKEYGVETMPPDKLNSLLEEWDA